ncbi:DUF4230 domain-containing protein [Sphingomonas sp.]|uniref:DUF4230 domain-containing protein n=1 Tax=Sphingomonas sp. TaxID=28214 RepID=UPI003B00AD03
MRAFGRVLLFAGLTAILLGGIGLWGLSRFVRHWTPDPTTIASSSLEGLKAQNRLSVLAASYVAVVTSTQRRLGLAAQRTMILPGRVRYEVDLARLGSGDVAWSANARRLDVTLPPIEVAGPEIDLARIRQYDSGGLLLGWTDAGAKLDAANRRAAQAELMRQARAPAMLQIARDNARRDVARSFALPLRAAGLDPQVRVRFADEPGFPAVSDNRPMERSRSLREALGIGR